LPSVKPGSSSRGGGGASGTLGHGDERDQFSPKRVEALRGVRVSSVSAGSWHVLALPEDGQVYAWGEESDESPSDETYFEKELLP
jgi:alpha-tubulin suppressor-like RCC1 family protein